VSNLNVRLFLTINLIFITIIGSLEFSQNFDFWEGFHNLGKETGFLPVFLRLFSKQAAF
jgi:hypothetical protein